MVLFTYSLPLTRGTLSYHDLTSPTTLSLTHLAQVTISYTMIKISIAMHKPYTELKVQDQHKQNRTNPSRANSPVQHLGPHPVRFLPGSN